MLISRHSNVKKVEIKKYQEIFSVLLHITGKSIDYICIPTRPNDGDLIWYTVDDI